jgi:hypothetical protein
VTRTTGRRIRTRDRAHRGRRNVTGTVDCHGHGSGYVRENVRVYSEAAASESKSAGVKHMIVTVRHGHGGVIDDLCTFISFSDCLNFPRRGREC